MRGKKASAAANRRTATEVEETITSYQNAVKRLTAENADLKKKAAEQKAIYDREKARMSADLQESVSPELRAMRKKITELLDEMGRLRITAGKATNSYMLLAKSMVTLLEGMGFSPLEAREMVIAGATDDFNEGDLMDDEGNLQRKTKAQMQIVLQRAKGLRH